MGNLTLLLTLRCPNCNNADDLMVVGVCEGGILAVECPSCEKVCGFHLTELTEACLGAQSED